MADLVEHDVRHDTAGWAGRPRLTCYSKDCPVRWGDTLLAQPYMSQEEWDILVAAFMEKHPRTVLSCADRGGPLMIYDKVTNAFTRKETV